MIEVEALRASYRPQCITTLFVGESAPASGAFFYRGNTSLKRHMEQALAASGLVGNSDFLERFKSYGWYLDDLVLTPVDRLPRPERRLQCETALESLATRIADYQPQAIVSLMRGIERFVNRAARRKRCGGSSTATKCRRQ